MRHQNVQSPISISLCHCVKDKQINVKARATNEHCPMHYDVASSLAKIDEDLEAESRDVDNFDPFSTEKKTTAKNHKSE